MNLWGLRSTDSGDLGVILIILILAAGSWLGFLRLLPRILAWLLAKVNLPQVAHPFQDFSARAKVLTYVVTAGVGFAQGVMQNPNLFSSAYGEPLPAVIFEGALLLVFMCVVVRYVVAPPLAIVFQAFGHAFRRAELWGFACAFAGGIFLGALAA